MRTASMSSASGPKVGLLLSCARASALTDAPRPRPDPLVYSAVKESGFRLDHPQRVLKAMHQLVRAVLDDAGASS